MDALHIEHRIRTILLQLQKHRPLAERPDGLSGGERLLAFACGVLADDDYWERLPKDERLEHSAVQRDFLLIAVLFEARNASPEAAALYPALPDYNRWTPEQRRCNDTLFRVRRGEIFPALAPWQERLDRIIAGNTTAELRAELSTLLDSLDPTDR